MNTNKKIIICTAAIVMSAAMFFAACDNPWIGPKPGGGPVTNALENAIDYAQTLADLYRIEPAGTLPADMPYGVHYVYQTDVDTLNAAIAAAEAALASAATQTDVDNAKTALETAIEVFVEAKQTGTKDVINAEIETLISDANTAKAGIEISENGTGVSSENEWVTQEQMDALNAVISVLETAKASGTQQEKNVAYAALLQAIEEFELAKEEGSSGIAAGAAVSAPTATGATIMANSITVTAVAAPANGQTVEYGISTTNNAASATWQDSPAFTGLTAGTTYYIFARSKENGAFNAGTPSAGLQVATTGSGKAAGATVSAPTATGATITADSITVTAVAAPANGQTVEYAKNTTNAAPSTGWQNSPAFTELTAGTTYYIFARSKENGTFNAGTPSAGLQIVTTGGISYAIGETGPGDGIVFYYSEAGFTVAGLGTCHYLEATPVNQATSITWANQYYNVPKEAGIGKGKANTANIITWHSYDTTSNNAAMAAVAYSGGGKNDWFLPSLDELNAMYEAKTHLGISSGIFWSSESYGPNSALTQDFESGVQHMLVKLGYGGYANVRAIRAF